MRLELLVFDALVLGPPLIASFGRATFFADRWRMAWPAAWIVGLAAMVGLAAAAGGSIEFSPEHTLVGGPLSAFGVPIGAYLLALAVPFACVFCWWAVFARARPEPAESPGPASRLRAVAGHGLLVAAGMAAILRMASGQVGEGEWALLGLALCSPLDLALGTRLVGDRRFWTFLLVSAVLTLVFGGWLLVHGVVSHGGPSLSGLRPLGVPVEDLGLAMAAAGATTLIYEGLGARERKRPRKGLIARWIERRFGGYRHLLEPVDESLPRKLGDTGRAIPRVAVIGSGLAGLGAAAKLSERGFAVTLFERNDYLGGKLGAWTTTMPDGREIGMSHGFHAFFRHYYNLNEFLASLGVTDHYRDVGDYLILTTDGRSTSFKEVSTTPLLNLLSLARHGVYKLREVAGRHTGPKMEAFMRYDAEATYAEWDEVSYAEFADDARLPDSLRRVFNTFARAFFSDAETMSMAELIKSFHFYYLSNDGGLIFDYLDDDFTPVLLDPIRAHLEAHGVEIRTGHEVGEITVSEAGEGGRRFGVGEERFDYLIVASDVVGTTKIFAASPSLAASAPETAARVEATTAGQRYCVWRMWLDRGVERELPGFVFTERAPLLDSITLVHQTERESAEWVAQREAAGAGSGGAVVELHCYAVPEDMSDEQDALEAELREGLRAELATFLPELAEAEIVHDYLYVRRDFPAFHVGRHATRPRWKTELDGLYLAGDWVVLPIPAMLMEAAYSAGLLAANDILEAESLQPEPVWTVPLRGFMADWRRRPG